MAFLCASLSDAHELARLNWLTWLSSVVHKIVLARPSMVSSANVSASSIAYVERML